MPTQGRYWADAGSNGPVLAYNDMFTGNKYNIYIIGINPHKMYTFYGRIIYLGTINTICAVHYARDKLFYYMVI